MLSWVGDHIVSTVKSKIFLARLRLSAVEEEEKLSEKKEKQKANRRGSEAETNEKRRLQVL